MTTHEIHYALLGKVDYRLFYDFVDREEQRLKREEDIVGDYRMCKALAACCEMRDYLANRIALLEARGEIESDEDYDYAMYELQEQEQQANGRSFLV